MMTIPAITAEAPMSPKPDSPALASAKRVMAQRRAMFFMKAMESDPLLTRPGIPRPERVAAIALGGKYKSPIMG